MEGSYQLSSFTENKNAEVKRLKAQVDLFFDKEFEVYEKFGLKNGMKIIECGSGPGFLIKNILQKLPDCDATALEIDPFLLEVLKENSIENNKKLFDVKHTSIYDTQLPDNTFDFAVTRIVVEHLQYPENALKELYRILKPGGKLVIVSNDFAYHLLTYPIIPELDEMYKAYCQSRFSEGGNPLIGRQIPTYLKKEKFTNIKFEIISVHSDLVGDKALLQAENVNISKSLVSEGFLKKETLDALAANWYKMLKDPDHIIYRQLFVICGEKSLHYTDSTSIPEKDTTQESAEVVTSELKGLNKEEQEHTIRSFLTNKVKRIMGDEDLNVKYEEKLCDIDIDSIAAAELSSIIQTNFNKLVSISDILQKFSINDVAKIILESSEEISKKYPKTKEYGEEQKIVKENLYEISHIQEQFWILYKVYPKNTAYNIPSALKIEGEINLTALESGINQIVNRHEILRASFLEKNNKVYQKVRNDAQIQYKIDIVTMHEPFNDNVASKQILNEVHKTFDLTKWPLFRIKLFSFDNKISILTAVFHHSIIDLQSRQVFARELTELYNSYSSGKPVVVMDPINKYSDYSLWLNNWLFSDDAKNKIEEWREEIPQTPEPLQVSPDFSRPKVDNLEGKRKHFMIDSNTSFKVTRFAEDHAVNAFTVLLAAYSILLNRLSNQSKFIIGVPLTNRRKVEFTDTFGCFVNIVPILVDFYENITGDEILLQIRQSLLRAHRKQEVPFIYINDLLRNKGSNSILQAGFTFEPPMQLQLNGLEVSPMEIERNGSQLDLFFTLWKKDGCFHGYAEYNTDLFKESTIQRWIGTYESIIEEFIKNPDKSTDNLDILTNSEIQQIILWNDTDSFYENDICLHQKFEKQTQITPDSIALFTNNEKSTYRELNQQSNKLAHYLISKGICPDDFVSICIERSAELMIGIFAILKAGGAYMPIDPQTPPERLISILDDAKPKLILTTSGAGKNIPSGRYSVIDLDSILSEPLSSDDSNPDVAVNSHNLAYVIYTSGSTGIPKGVMIEHHSVMNRLGWMQDTYHLTASDVLLQKTPVTFDVSVWELFWWSFSGAGLVMLPPGAEKEPKTLIETIRDYKVSVIHFVPSMFGAFINYLDSFNEQDKIGSLRNIFLSGEALPPNMVNEFRTIMKDCTVPDIINLYGPTEATVDVSYYHCPKDSIIDIMYIGKPISNTKLMVVDKNHKIQSIGIPGELVITGVNLARGYLNREELNKEKFIDIEYFDGRILRAYRTGDLTKWSDTGDLFFIGRIDDQVKIRGYRIELGDIEAKLLEHEAVDACAVVVNKSDPLHPQLTAYVTLKKESGLSSEEIKEFLLKKLPEYMIPAQYMFIDKMTFTPSGKINRKALPEPSFSTQIPLVEPSNNIEKLLLGIWKSVLKTDNIGINSNFFDLGGNSILAINLASLISKKFNITLKTLTIFEFPSIKDQSKFLAGKENDRFSTKDNEIYARMERKKNVRFKKYRK